ncbi:MAG: N-acetylneuraminate synthase family protein [Candidatus Omnitrophota bacterium]
MPVIRLGNRIVGDNRPCFIAAEIGRNHNGDIDIARRLIDIAVLHKADAVKFQKRTIEAVYSKEELALPVESPFGTTNRDLKQALEFGPKEYREIDRYCRKKGILWFASCWDTGSVDFISKFNPPCYKISSACLTDERLLRYIKSKNRPVILSTGMSTMEQIARAVKIIGRRNLVLLHCVSSYPAAVGELNLRVIERMKDKFKCPTGYSGHETGVITSVMAAMMGACLVERHITLDRAMWGSDHAASLEPRGLELLVRYIRTIPVASGNGEKKVYKSEIPVMKRLRKAEFG